MRPPRQLLLTIVLTSAIAAAPAAASSPGSGDALAELQRTTGRLAYTLVQARRDGRSDPAILARIDERAGDRAAARDVVSGRAALEPLDDEALMRAMELDRVLIARGQPATTVFAHRPAWKRILADMAVDLRNDRFTLGTREFRRANGELRATVDRLAAAATVYRLDGFPGPDAYAAGRSLIPDGCVADLRWSHPRLRRPVIVPITTSGSRVVLDDDQDYLLDLGAEPVQKPIRVIGGRNVVIAGGRVDVIAPSGYGPGLAVRDQAAGATVSIESIELGGPRLGDGIFIQQPNDTTVQIQNVRVDELHSDDEVNFSTIHPDVVQTNSGPDLLRIDRLSGQTPYQGVFLKPNDPAAAPTPGNDTTAADLSRIDLRTMPDRTSSRSALLWQSEPFSLRTNEIWVDGGTRPADQLMRPSSDAWPGARIGLRPEGPFVPAGSTSPGSCTEASR